VVVSAAMDRTVRVWDAASGQALAVWDAHPDVVETVAICPDGRTLLSGGINDSHLRIWDLQTLEPSSPVEGPFNSIEKITVGPREGIALCAVDDTWRGSLSILDLKGRAWRQHLRGHADRVGDIALSADESLAASVSLDHTLRLWNLREDAEAAHLTLDAGLVAVAMAHDGSWVAAGSESGTLHFARPVWPTG
jgi:WD40 repeat protein